MASRIIMKAALRKNSSRLLAYSSLVSRSGLVSDPSLGCANLYAKRFFGSTKTLSTSNSDDSKDSSKDNDSKSPKNQNQNQNQKEQDKPKATPKDPQTTSVPEGSKSEPVVELKDSAASKGEKKRVSLPNRGRRSEFPENAKSSAISSSVSQNAGFSVGSKKASSDSRGAETVIPPEKKFVPIAIPRRPLFPGLGGFCTFTDPEQIKTFQELDRNKAWDRSVVVFLGKNIESAKFLDEGDDVYGTGCSCHVETIETSVGRDKTTLYVALYPTCRVTKGRLLSPTKDSDETEAEQSTGEASSSSATVAAPTKVAQSDNGLDTASFDVIPSTEVDHPAIKWMDQVVAISDAPYNVEDKNIQDLCSKIIDALHQLSNNSFVVRLHLERFSKLFPHSGGTYTNPSQLADFCAASCSGAHEVQQILETLNVEERLVKSFDLINRELASIELNDKITKALNAEMTQRHKKALLHEQQKIIAKELGNDNGKEKLIATFRERMSKLNAPDEIKELVESEIAKFEFQEHSGEATVSRTYLDWLTQLPWGLFSNDSYDIAAAKQLMDSDHFGLEDVKKRILEFIAIGKLKGSVDGKIICLHGPPGVGKTSIARSIAKSLGRKFERISLGGVYDASEIKGHRRTYVGALPGNIVQALKRCQTQNPVILLDEIDKTGRTGLHGDVSATLLEVLDPAQNNKFFDVYLEAPIDISKTLFICTANDISVIQRPLLDRMELIELSAYDRYEKATIARQYLIKDAQKECGLENRDVTFTSDAVDNIVKHYTVDAGVRTLKQMIVKIMGKVALEVVDGTIAEGSPIIISSNKVTTYLGPPIRVSDRIYERCDPGIVLGLAANSMGGSALFVESVLQQPLSINGTPKVTRTGLLGETISESSSIAYTFSRMFMTKHYPGNSFFSHAVIHTHLPEGGIKKDGPSAGITMTTSLLSLALNRAVRPNIAMTGEITLAGKVLPVGAIRSKVVAARSAGCDTVIFPKENLADWEELPDYLKDGIQPVPVEWYEEVFNVAFGDVPLELGENVWKEQLDKSQAEEDAKRLRERGGFDSPPSSGRSPIGVYA